MTVLVVSCGGTIAAVPGPGGATPELGADRLVAGLDGVEPLSWSAAPSAHGTLAEVVTLHGALAARLRDRRLDSEGDGGREGGLEGIVVTQGTDTLEEVAFALDLLWDDDTPLVVTGAMRHTGLPGADGPANLAAAVAVARSPQARGMGVLVAAADEVHAARLVRKTHTSSVATFRSPSAGPVGFVVEGRVRLLLAVPRRPRLAPAEPAPVALLTASLGDDGRLLGSVRQLGYQGLGYRGLVIEALGGGHLPPGWLPALSELAGQLPVVLASRTGAGQVLRDTYDFPGAEGDLLARGLIPAGVLDGAKARVLLALALGAGVDAADAFAVHG